MTGKSLAKCSILWSSSREIIYGNRILNSWKYEIAFRFSKSEILRIILLNHLFPCMTVFQWFLTASSSLYLCPAVHDFYMRQTEKDKRSLCLAVTSLCHVIQAKGMLEVKRLAVELRGWFASTRSTFQHSNRSSGEILCFALFSFPYLQCLATWFHCRLGLIPRNPEQWADM
jgi:hypothetical protein